MIQPFSTLARVNLQTKTTQVFTYPDHVQREGKRLLCEESKVFNPRLSLSVKFRLNNIKHGFVRLSSLQIRETFFGRRLHKGAQFQSVHSNPNPPPSGESSAVPAFCSQNNTQNCQLRLRCLTARVGSGNTSRTPT